MAKSWWTSKTIWVNVIALIGSVVIAQGVAPDQWATIALGVTAVANVALRLITGQSIDFGTSAEK